MNNSDHVPSSFLQLGMDDSTFQSYSGSPHASYGFSLTPFCSFCEAQTYRTTCSSFGNSLHLLSNFSRMHSGVVFCVLGLTAFCLSDCVVPIDAVFELHSQIQVLLWLLSRLIVFSNLTNHFLDGMMPLSPTKRTLPRGLCFPTTFIPVLFLLAL